jgi:hypothetical protein
MQCSIFTPAAPWTLRRLLLGAGIETVLEPSRLYTGSPDHHRFTPLLDVPIIIFACDQCAARYYEQLPLKEPDCPDCGHGPLQRVGVWDMRLMAWPWLQQGGEG